MSWPTGVPGYWMNETSGVLQDAVEAYLALALGEPGRPELTAGQIAALRAYFRQWIWAPGFIGPDVAKLRRLIDGLTSRAAIRDWLKFADEVGVDPL